MSGESLSSKFFATLRECSETTDELTNSESHPPLANGKCHEPQADNENQKPSSTRNSSWRTKSNEEKPAPLTNWRDRSQPRNTTSAFSYHRGGVRREESNGAFQPNDVFVRRISTTGQKSSNSFGERRSKFGRSFIPESNGSASSALPGSARKAFGDSRNKFGSNSSIASDCSTSSFVHPGDHRKPLSDSRKRFGSGWSLASESSTTVNGEGFGGGASYARSNVISVSNSRTGERMKPTREGAVGSTKLTLKYLETVCRKEVNQIVLEVTIDKSPFDGYLQKSPLEPDWLMLILSIVAKVCVSDYEGNRRDLLYKLCKSPFLNSLSLYLGDVTVEANPETVEKLPTFIHNLCEFYSSLLVAWPMLAVEKKLNKLITKTKAAVINIPIYLGVTIDEDIPSKLETYTDIFDECKKMLEEKQLVENRIRSKMEKLANTPPDNFRSLSLYPTAEDLFRIQRGFIRPNKIKGAYENVEHYLDVQFRLLREDFVDSVRSGVQKYLSSKSEPRRRYKFDNVRMYPDTRLMSWQRMSSGSLEVGVRLNFDPRGKFAYSCDWAHNKRFMYGSLLLLSADDFSTFTCATVLERDLDNLKYGCVLAALVEQTPDFHKVFAKPFTMAECEVFFEPYFLILQMLKTLNERSFPMPEYIVQGQAITKPPSYPPEEKVGGLYSQYLYECRRNFTRRRLRHWDDDSNSDSDYYYDYDCGYGEDIDPFWHFRMLVDDDGDSPAASINSFQLDMYQTEAFKAGIERDFCVIQGPPGTGKTFLGLKLVKSILEECRWNLKKLPILVVCLTNHALDQFLERILAFTGRIVRVGGQSRNSTLNDHNLRTFRSALLPTHRRMHHRRKKDYDCESMTSRIKKVIADLGTSIENLKKMKKYIETPEGVLSSMFLKRVVEPNFLPVVENDETLLQWLLEDNECETHVENDLINFCHLYENDTINNEDPEPVIAKKSEKNISIYSHSIFKTKGMSYSVTLSKLERELQTEKERYEFLVQTESSFLEQGLDSNVIYFEKNYLKNRIKYLTRQYHKLKANLETSVENPEAKVLNAIHQDPSKLPSRLRWLIYWSWLSGLQEQLSSQITEWETLRQVKTVQYEEYKMFEDLHILKQSDIVGMTTTGAARLNKLLTLLKPAIVIVEEAAEVLETHIVAALTKSCRHLILIGDHKQLRPSAAVYELSKQYNIDVSLFERMINNGMHCPMLKVQHRMRPEISALITPLIYPDLKNHESVMSLESVRGVGKNMFFLDHNMPEAMTDEETSKENVHEAEFVVKLAEYFILQGYSSENITLLTFYAGQMFRIRNLMKNKSLNGVKCIVVDNYQGEENDIIVLSLVRSNDDGNIGFLSIKNRVCVALSRAKNGFFMIGNMDCLAKSRLWQKLRDILKQNDAIGKEFPLYCDRHDKITPVSNAKDFRLVTDGGCGAVCNKEMECGHNCPKVCHPILGEHESVDCEEPCKKLCPSNHECNKLCKEECGKCVSFVEKELPCQHSALVHCHVDENEYLCTELVEDVLLACDHMVKRKCHQKPEDVDCTKPCGKRLDCNHTCTRLCHEEDDPNHIQFQCQKPCGKYYEGCKKAHLCEKVCSAECGRCPFEEVINLSCGHELTVPCSTDLSSVKCPRLFLEKCAQCGLDCMKPCGENCHPCVNKVRKVIPTCGHEIDINCSEEPNQKLCEQNCQLMAPCGHKCQLKCGETCDSKGCKEWVTSNARKPVCGHENIYVLCGQKNEVFLKTPENFLANCQEPCNTILECGDVCSGTCGQCLQGRLHLPCPKLCGRTFICGHRCKLPCQKLCPPCYEPCSFRCPHSKCKEKCGIPCSTCKKSCEWKCKHTKCSRKCGDICNRQPCNKPCELKLPCGHDCIGFCGEPCPQQCRFCNPEIANVIFGYEDAPDARFVLMVDCNHVIESQALDLYFSPTFKGGEIVLRGCPLCGTPITKTLRYMNFVKRTYQQIAEVKTKNFKDLRSFDMSKIFQDWRIYPFNCSGIQLFFNFTQFCTKNIPDCFEKHTIFSSEILSNFIYFFQVCQALILHVPKFGIAPMENEFFKNHVLPYLDKLIRRLQISFNVNRQLMLDFNLELRRYHLMIDYQSIKAKFLSRFNDKDTEVTKICAEIEQILFGFTKFTHDDEEKIKSLFETLRTRPRIGSEFYWPKKELAMKKEMPKIFDDLKAGSWFQCLNEHYYCIDQKENVSNCPECAKKGTLVTNQSSRRRRRRGRR